jgi:hypothetical protein
MAVRVTPENVAEMVTSTGLDTTDAVNEKVGETVAPCGTLMLVGTERVAG